MKNNKKLLMCTISFLTVQAVTNAQAADSPATTMFEDKDCAIWMCLPGGFPDGCESSEDSLLKRLKNGQSPVPTMQSCMGADNAKSTEINNPDNAKSKDLQSKLATRQAKALEEASGDNENDALTEEEKLQAVYDNLDLDKSQVDQVKIDMEAQKSDTLSQNEAQIKVEKYKADNKGGYEPSALVVDQEAYASLSIEDREAFFDEKLKEEQGAMKSYSNELIEKLNTKKDGLSDPDMATYTYKTRQVIEAIGPVVCDDAIDTNIDSTSTPIDAKECTGSSYFAVDECDENLYKCENQVTEITLLEGDSLLGLPYYYKP